MDCIESRGNCRRTGASGWPNLCGNLAVKMPRGVAQRLFWQGKPVVQCFNLSSFAEHRCRHGDQHGTLRGRRHQYHRAVPAMPMAIATALHSVGLVKRPVVAVPTLTTNGNVPTV